MADVKRVYTFDNKEAEGNGKTKEDRETKGNGKEWQFFTLKQNPFHAVADAVPLRVLRIVQGLRLPMSD